MQKYITYEEPFKNEIFAKSGLKNIYEKYVNKEEYESFEIWLLDMIKMQIFIKI